ncbi:MAG: 3-oxoacyl-[acyl-carrier-protein] synthase-3 [Phycisphaerales bacterium]|jgi:3-oxoacyl-[acyl-carrier-protein] synthase-3
MTPTPPPPPPPPLHQGVSIIGSGSALPTEKMTNADLEECMETSDDWIVQRTGIRERRKITGDESTTSLATEAVRVALDDAGIAADELDLVLAATMTPDMPTPGVAPLVASNLGCGLIPAWDMNAACSGFVYALNVASDLIRCGSASTVAVVGADTLTRHVDYSTYGRGAAILFGDAASTVILRRSENASLGRLAQAMHSDGSGAKHLAVPCLESHFHNPDDFNERKLNRVHMNGQAVFKFAVKKFPEVIEETLGAAGLTATDVDHFVCHQANARILESARERFGLPEEKLLVNIDRYGNTVAASCPLLFDEQRRAGQIKPGQRVMFIAFGAGLTWGASLWQL